MTQKRGDSYPRLREVLGEEAFAELAHLIRKTYEANEERRRRRGGDSGGPQRQLGRSMPSQ
jgi:hypothetical protein